MHDVRIRIEEADDVHATAEVVRAAFGGDVEPRLVEAIRSSELFLPALSLVAEADGEVVGHVMVSHVFLDLTGGGRRLIASLSPLAVVPERHGQGIGGALVQAVTAAADERGEPLVVLEGSPVYYGRFGFEPAADHGIVLTVPDWAPPEAAQVLRLSSYAPSVCGRVVYPPAFDEAAADH